MADTNTSAKVQELKGILRETEIPFFSDSEIEYQLTQSHDNVDEAAYRLCIIKAEKCPLSISGLTLSDSSEYWLRLAAMYRPSFTTIAD